MYCAMDCKRNPCKVQHSNGMLVAAICKMYAGPQAPQVVLVVKNPLARRGETWTSLGEWIYLIHSAGFSTCAETE